MVKETKKDASSRGSALNALLACPCCGSNKVTRFMSEIGDSDVEVWTIECDECDISAESNTEDEVEKTWNTRYLFEPVKISVTIGEINIDNQLGNFYNAIDEVVCYFQEHSGEIDVNLSKTLKLLADRLDEC